MNTTEAILIGLSLLGFFGVAVDCYQAKKELDAARRQCQRMAGRIFELEHDNRRLTDELQRLKHWRSLDG